MSDRDTFVLSLPPWVLRRRGARMLDPVTAPRPVKGDQVSPRVASSTAYLEGRLLVRGLPSRAAQERSGELEALLERRGYQVQLRVDPQDESFEGLLSQVVGEQDGVVEAFDEAYQTRLLVEPVGERPQDVDPWALVLIARSAGMDGVDLEHLVIPGPGGAYWDGHGPGAYWDGHGPGAYWEGHGGGAGSCLPGRAPVSLAMSDPSSGRPMLKRHPVIVVPDTGIGAHPWFDGHDRVQVLHHLLGVPVMETTTPDPELHGVTEPLIGELDRLSGHGTFIAGVLRQCAPDAHLVSLPLMDASGTAAEGDVSRALSALLIGHIAAQAEGRTDFGEDGGVLDVLSLSLGFYHQDGQIEEHPVRDLLRLFARFGVMVVAAAGNQATGVPLYPAGWAVHAGSGPPRDRMPPLVAVGALNPDGQTVAMFSNAGPWVTTHRPGVNVVSTMPTTFDASARAHYSTEVDKLVRATPHPDNMRGGFGVWSGTSFAAPWLAGQLAAQVAAHGDGSVDSTAMRTRAMAALEAELGW